MRELYQNSKSSLANYRGHVASTYYGYNWADLYSGATDTAVRSYVGIATDLRHLSGGGELMMTYSRTMPLTMPVSFQEFRDDRGLNPGRRQWWHLAGAAAVWGGKFVTKPSATGADHGATAVLEKLFKEGEQLD